MMDKNQYWGITENCDPAFNLEVFDNLYKGNTIITKRLTNKLIEKLVEHQDKISNNKNTNETNKNINYLKILEFKKTMYEDKEVSKIICIDTSSKKHELILMPDGRQDILNVKVESIIMPISISTRSNFTILNDYKIVKAVENNTENKKAV